MSTKSYSRRSFLTLAGAAAAAFAGLALAGCGSSSSDSASDSDDSGSSATGAASMTEDEIRAQWASFPSDPVNLYDAVPTSEEEMPTISVEELHDLMESGEQYALVDVNSSVMYADGHIDTALNYPWSASGFTQDPELPRGVKMVFYCVCQAEEDSMHMGFSAVNGYAYRNIFLLKGGTPAWEAAGYQLVK